MVSAIDSALSGVLAGGKQLEAHARNIAGQSATKSRIGGQVVNKPYVPQQVDQVSLSSGGVQAITRDSSQPSVTVYNPSDPAANPDGTVQMPNVDVAAELVGMKMDANNIKADLKAIKVQDNTTQSLLNIIS